MKIKTIGLASIFLLTLNGCVAPSDIKPNDHSMSTYDLCVAYSKRKIMYGKMTSSPNIINELKRRKAFTSSEWSLINNEQIQVGMSKDSLICSWGRPDRINRSSYGDPQYVYRTGKYNFQYAYVNEITNRVTAWN